MTASRPGYVTALVVTAPSADVVPGVITNDAPPSISGDAMVGSLLTARAGTWSLTPDSVSYQWRLDGEPIAGATSSTFLATAREGGHNLSVRVTVRADGYTTTSELAAPAAYCTGQRHSLISPSSTARRSSAQR